MTAYKMAIVFALDISLNELNHITEQIDGGRLVLNNAKEVIIEQTVGFVPSELHLKQYANAIQKAMNKDGRIHVENVRFVRYDYLTPINIPDTPIPHDITNNSTKYIGFHIECVDQQTHEHKPIIIYMSLKPTETTDWLDINPEKAKEQLLARIQAHLKTKKGWDIIQNTPETICWNNIASVLPFIEQGLSTNLPKNTTAEQIIQLTVNRYERLTPDITFGTLILSTATGDKTSIAGMLDIQTGSIQTKEDFSAKDFICGTFYPSGSSIGFICNSGKGFTAIYKE